MPKGINIDTQLKGTRPPYFCTDSGSANAYAVTPVSGALGPSLRTGSVIIFIAANANSGASTLQVLGGPLGPSSVIPINKSVSVALAANDILANQVVEVVYDGTNFQLVGGTLANFADWETPSGSINGSNTSFSLAHTPNPSTSLTLYYKPSGGSTVLLISGAGNDYTLATATISMLFTPNTGDAIYAFYRY